MIHSTTATQAIQDTLRSTARYDSMIANWLTSLDEGAEAKPAEAAPVPAIFPAKLQLAFDRTEILRYGENSHQSAAFYREPNPVAGSIAAYTQLQGKELSYNNIADSDAAWECVKSFDAPACVIVKHANPCGVAVDGTLLGAYEKSFKTVFSPQKYNLTPTAGMMPVEHIQAVLEECADNAQEVEIQFVEQQTKFGPQMQIFGVKPLPKKDLTQPQKP